MPGDTNSALTFVDGSMSVDCLHENLALNALLFWSAG